jgi:Icc-related predicted phosphoesterase
MRISYMSDLHCEFHADGGKSFVGSLDPAGIDVLVLAGDIAVGDGIGQVLDLFCRRYDKATVVYVHGNHEFYGTTRERVIEVTRAAVARHKNLRWLDCDVLELGGLRILGAPLWFEHPGAAFTQIRRGMNDFFQIKRFEDWVFAENERARTFLKRELEPGDLVVTHHLPAQACVSKRYRGHPLNAFFVCDVEVLMLEQEPATWIHGHTHDSLDLLVGRTRVLCNPFGYARHEENPAFREDASFTQDAR